MSEQKKRGRPRKKKEIEGLGDAVEAVTEATRIKSAVEWFSEKTGKDCGCDKRKEILNKHVRFKKRRTPNCMNKEQYDFWTEMRKDLRKNLSKRENKREAARLHSILFNDKFHVPCGSCGSTWKHWIKDIEEIYLTYKDEPEPSAED